MNSKELKSKFNMVSEMEDKFELKNEFNFYINYKVFI